MSQVGSVYKITNPITKGFYIGSTFKSPEQRFQFHKYRYNYYTNGNTNDRLSIYKLFENNNINICYVELVEAIVCNNVKELRSCEAKHILEAKRHNQPIINKNIPNRTLPEYYQDNKDKYKNYYNINKHKLLNYQKEYNTIHKESIKEYHKNYYIQNNNRNTYINNNIDSIDTVDNTP
jgi:hypothetical protein